MSNTNRRRQAVKDWFEKNPSKTQFYLTLLALGITVYFSKQSLEETRKQYNIAKGSLDNATMQLNLAKEQYKSQIQQRNQDLKINHIKDLAEFKAKKLDSERLSKNDLQQRKYNEFQSEINSQQLKVNKQQLLAIQTQAKVADAQFKFQKVQSANQFEDSRPIFTIDSIHINKSKSSYNPTISFQVINRGIRTPHVDSTVIAIWNSNLTCMKVEKHLTNTDLKDGNFTTGLQIYQDCIDNPNTIYYLNVIYRDTYSNELKSKHYFFQYVIKKDKSLSLLPVSDYAIIEFTKFLKQNEKILGRLI